MYKKSAQQFVYFVETLVASETHSEFGRRLLVEGEIVDMEGSKELNDEQYGKLYTQYITHMHLYFKLRCTEQRT